MYMVWRADDGSTLEDATKVEDAHGVRDAAELYAEKQFWGDPFEEMDLMVWSSEKPTKIYRVTVDVEVVPSFSSTIEETVDRQDPPEEEADDAI